MKFSAFLSCLEVTKCVNFQIPRLMGFKVGIFRISPIAVCMAKNLALAFNPYKPGILFMKIGKQNSPRSDAAKCGVPSGAILFAILIFIEK